MIDRNAGNALTVSGTPNSLIRAGGNSITVNVTPTAISGGGLIQSYGDNYAQGNSFPATFSGAPLGTN
jgi:hypothetical protein